MLPKFIPSTGVLIENPWRQEQVCSEKNCVSMDKLLMQGDILDIKCFNPMSEKEMLSITGIGKKEYHVAHEALGDLGVDCRNRAWATPTFDSLEMDYIIHVLSHHRPINYFDMMLVFYELAQEENQHPQMEIMERIFYKLDSLQRDDFVSIMDSKGITLDDYGFIR